MRYLDIINEIEIGGGVEPVIPDVHDTDLSSDQLDLFSEVPKGEPRLPPFMKLVGRMGEFYVAERIYDQQKKGQRGGTYIFIKDGVAASYIALKTYSVEDLNYPRDIAYKPDLHGNGLRVGAVFVRDEFRGSNLGVEMYVWVLQNVCDYLMADELQTQDGVKLWGRLKKDRRLAVEVWDGDKYQSRARKTGKDWNHIYNVSHLIPWVTLRGKVEQVLYGHDE
jgi:hypothetical protein